MRDPFAKRTILNKSDCRVRIVIGVNERSAQATGADLFILPNFCHADLSMMRTYMMNGEKEIHCGKSILSMKKLRPEKFFLRLEIGKRA
jgi:hypothetical protein